MERVRQMFPQHVISRFGDVSWPPCSPDLSACDFFLWGYLKSRVYANKPRWLQELKINIRQEIARVPKEVILRVMHNFPERLQMCDREVGRHLTDITFHHYFLLKLHYFYFI